jgi:hypothetical protein
MRYKNVKIYVLDVDRGHFIATLMDNREPGTSLCTRPTQSKAYSVEVYRRSWTRVWVKLGNIN